MSDEKTLRETARKVIHGGTLPNRPPDRTWGGPGAGIRCPICGMAVKQDDIELEIEFAPDGDEATPGTYHVHTRCFAVWDSERRNLEREGSETATSTADGSSD